MSKRSEAVKAWRRRTKERIVEAMGGECVCCGYKKCNDSLALHHLDPEKKELSFSKIIANPKTWDKIVEELRKCILVCHNCHFEIHANVRDIPEVYSVFNEDYSKYREIVDQKDECPVCGEMKSVKNITCSRKCASKRARKIDWDSVDLEKMIKEKRNWSEIGRIVGVSDVAVKKRAKKLNLI